MASKVALGTASTGPDDSLIAVDANGTTSEMVLSKVKSAATSAGSNLVDTAKKTAMDPKAIASSIKITNGKFGLDGGSLQDILTKGLSKANSAKRVGGVGGVNLTGIPGLSNSQSKLAEGYLGDIIGNSASEVINGAGQAYKIGDGIQTDSASGLMKGIAKLADFPAFASVLDQNSFTATALSYLDSAIAMGIPSAIDVLMKKIKDDKRARARILANVRGAVLRADIATIKIIIEYIGAPAVMQQVPDAPVFILAAYNFPHGTKPKKYAALRAELIGLLSELDPLWDKEKRNGILVNKLDPFTRLSSAAKILLTLQPEYDVPIAMALSYRKVDLYGLLKKSYPLMIRT